LSAAAQGAPYCLGLRWFKWSFSERIRRNKWIGKGQW
jgi:hypothetical protein